MIDKKGRLFSKISVIDIVIALALIVTIFGFAYKFASGSATVVVSSDTPIEMVIAVKNVRKYTVDAMKVGDFLFEKHGQILGEITNIESGIAKDVVAQGDGTAVVGDVIGRFDAYVTLKCEGRVSDSGYYINANRQVAAGSAINIINKAVSSEATVFSVKEG